MKKILILLGFLALFFSLSVPANAQGVFYGGNCQPCVSSGGAYNNSNYVGGYYNSNGAWVMGPNTSALGAARHNEYNVTFWGVGKSTIEVVIGKKTLEIKPGSHKSYTIRAASIMAGLSSTNYRPEDWLTEVMIAVRKKGSTDEPSFRKITQIISNQLSFSKRELTIVVKDDGKGSLVLSQPAASNPDDE